MKKILFKTGVFLNWLVAILLILADLSVFVSPDSFSFFALLGLFFPFLLILNIIFLLFRIFYKKRYFFISLVAILFSWYRIADFYAFKKTKVISAPVNEIKIMSYNVRLFDLYNWTGKKSGEKIFKIIKNENPDILCIQEFFSRKNFNYQDKIISALHIKNYLISSKNKSGYSGNAIFSKYPVISSGFVDVGSSKQKCIYADIVKQRDTFRVYGIHLASIHLNDDDYNFMKNIGENNQDKNLQGVKGIGNKLLNAYQIRAKEVNTLAPHIASSPYPVIVCGDFNDTPVSYTYRNIKGNLKDAFIECGSGIGHTYAEGLPFFRIDYIFHDKKMKSKSYKRIKKNYSDHYPVCCEIEL